MTSRLRRAGDPASPGRQALVLLSGVVSGFLLGTAAGAPFDIDVGAGHAIFHFVLAVTIGLAALWLWCNGGADVAARFTRWLASALALAQFAEGVAAVPDGSGDSAAHEVVGAVNIVLLPAVLLVLLVLAGLALRRR